MTAITWPKLVDATKAFPNCQSLIKPIRTRLPEKKMDWPEEPTPYPSYRCHLTKTEGVTKSGNKTVTPANLRQKAPNTLCTGHAAATTMMTTANQEVINIKANKRLVTGNLGPQDTLDTDRFS